MADSAAAVAAESAAEHATASARCARRSSPIEKERDGEGDDHHVPAVDDDATPIVTLRPGTPTFEELVASLSAQPNGVAAGFGQEEAEGGDSDEGCGRSTTPELAELLEADFLAEAHLGADGRPKPLPPLPPDSRGEDSAVGAVPGLSGRGEPDDDDDDETRRRGLKKRGWLRLEDALFNVLKHMREATQQSAAAVGAVSVEEDKGKVEPAAAVSTQGSLSSFFLFFDWIEAGDRQPSR
jgi:hypothetical protein